MTKKILAAFLAVMMIVSMLPTAFAAEVELKCPGVDEKHNKDNCDYVRVEEEPIVEPDCCTPGYTLYACQKCEAYFASDIKEPLGGCQKELIAEEVPATCGKEGTTAIYKCGKNGTQYGGESIKALEHDWVHSNGDCTVAHTKTCNNCGKTEEVAAAPGHTWENGFTNLSIKIKTEPTLTTDGVFVYVCQNSECKAESPEYVIHAHKHTYVANPGTPNSCTAAGVKAHYTCSYEGCEMLFDGEYKATTAAGLVLEKKEHSYVDADDTGYVYDEWNTFIENTCQTSGYTLRKCTECEKWYEEAHIEADPNKHTWEVIEPAVVGSCTVEGKTAVEYCKVCRIVRGGETIEGTGEGHHEVTVRVEATCTKMGYTYKYCDNKFCTLKEEAYIVENELVADNLKLIPDTAQTFPVDPDAHTLGWVITEEATCVAPGHKIWACTECKGEGTATGDYAAIEIGDAENGGHKWKMDSIADCENAEKWHCLLCNSENYADAKPALGHTSKNPDGTQAPVLTKHPTCNANGTGKAGYTYQLCVRCKKEEINKQAIEYNATYIYDNETDARNQHTLENIAPVEYKKGNCTDKGLWTLGKCSNCDRTVLLTMEGTGEGHKQPAIGVLAPTCTTAGFYTCQNEWCENKYNQVISPPLGHTLSFVERKDPTCNTNGVKAHWECATCKKNFVDTDWVISDDKTTISGVLVDEILMDCIFVGAQQPNLTTEIVASEYGSIINWKVKEETVDGTYTFVNAAAEYTIIIKDGLFEVALVKTNESQVIDKLGHSNLIFIESVDCEQYGYRLEICERCRQSDMYEYVPELGHDMSEESVFTSCTTDKKFVCLRDGCDHSVVDEGTAPGHKNSDGDFFWEGCQDKEDNRHCVVCKCLISNAHDLYVEINDAPATCTQPGYDLVVCEVCDYEEIIIKDEPLGHDWVRDGECKDKSFAPTTNEPGNVHYCCSRCDACKDEPVDVINGVQFTIKADNAVVSGANTDEEGNFNPVDGDVISYEITMSALQMNVWGFNFDVFYNAASMNFLGYTYNAGDVFANYNVDNITEDKLIYEFDVTHGADVNGNSINDLYGTFENVFGTIKVSAYTENDIEGKIQDALVNGTQSVITLYFQVETKFEYTFMGVPGYRYNDEVFVDMEEDYRDNYSWPTVVNSEGEVKCGADWNYAEASTMMDINGSGDVTITDLYFCNQILTGEAEYEYLAAADANKDGQITITDLDLMNQLLQGADESIVYEALEWTAPEGFVAA